VPGMKPWSSNIGKRGWKQPDSPKSELALQIGRDSDVILVPVSTGSSLGNTLRPRIREMRGRASVLAAAQKDKGAHNTRVPHDPRC
jgi:hypothetical protein